MLNHDSNLLKTITMKCSDKPFQCSLGIQIYVIVTIACTKYINNSVVFPQGLLEN